MFPNARVDPTTLPATIKQLLYLPTLGPGRRESLCIICREDIHHDQPSATHQCCDATLCKTCFLSYILQKTWDTKTNVTMAADCPYCKRPILRPHPYAQQDVIMVATTTDLVRQCVGECVFFCKPLTSRQQGDLLSDEQAMMMLDPYGKHPRAQQQYEEMKAHRAKGWRVFCFEEASPSTFLVAEGCKTVAQCVEDMANVHPALRQRFVAPQTQVPHAQGADSCIEPGAPSSASGSGRAPPSIAASTPTPGRLKRLWNAATKPARDGVRADGWRLAYAGGC